MPVLIPIPYIPHTHTHNHIPPLLPRWTDLTLTIQYKARNTITHTRNAKFVEKMLGDWTHSDSLKEAGVSIEQAFARYVYGVYGMGDGVGCVSDGVQALVYGLWRLIY